jgi:hypothetical protein
MNGNGAGRHTGNGLDHDAPFAIVPRRLIGELKRLRLTKTELLVYLELLTYRNAQKGSAFPSLNEVARDIGCASRHCARAITRLQKVGLLCKQPRRSQAGGHIRTLYTFPEAVQSDDKGASPKPGTTPYSQPRDYLVPNQGNQQTDQRTDKKKERADEAARARGSGDDEEPDPIKAALYDLGLKVLGDSERARRLLGKWRRIVGLDGEVELLDLFRCVRRNQIAEPIGYIEKALRRRAERAEFGPGYRPMASAAGG